MKVIFLDIDGVLNTTETHNPRGFPYVVEQHLVERFNRLVDQTGAAVVLISTWRLDPIGLLAARHFGVTITDCTPDTPDQPRADEITSWLRDHPEVTRFAVVDDTQDGFENLPFFQTDRTRGLTQDVADRLVHHFRSEYESPSIAAAAG
jgi:hypothetical protein